MTPLGPGREEMVQQFDLIAIGSGAGLDVANAIASRGFRVAIIENGPLGGTCLNRGCIPSKLLIHSADVVETLRRAHLFGVHVKGYEIDFPSIVRRVTEYVDHEAQQIEEGLGSVENPKLFKDTCRFVGMKTLRVGNETLRADRILIASGGRPRIPNVPGLAEAGFITSDEALRLTEQPTVLTILGGGYIAAELAHFFGSLGTKIQIVQRRDRLVPNEDEEVALRFTENARKRYDVYTGYDPTRVTRTDGRYETHIRSVDGTDSRVLTSDRILVAAGRIPNSDRLDLDKTGVRVDGRGFVVTDEYLETNVKGIYALGDAVGHYLFRHSANLEAQYSFWNLLDQTQRVPVDYNAMPHAIFGAPQIAGVGKTEQELRAAKTPYRIGRWNYIDTAMGKALEDQAGFVKILADPETGRILGCHILGTDASALIHEVIVAMKAGEGTVGNITRAVHIHPALPEVVQRAAASIGR